MKWVLLLLVACGRLGFEPAIDSTSDGALINATSDSVDVAGDSALADLLLYFTFDGPLLHDELGHDATCVTCATAGAGKRGGGAVFTGSECLFVADAPDLRPAAFTFAVWVNIDTAPNAMTAFGRAFMGATSTQNTMEVYVNMGFWHAVVNTIEARANARVSANMWHHIAGRFDGDVIRVFVDGVADTELTTGPAVYASDDYRIGCELNANAEEFHFSGVIDELRLYSRALTASEISGLAAP